MAFGDAGQAPKLPSVYCVGQVSKVTNLRASKKAAEGSPYHVIDVEIDPLFAPSKQVYKYYFTFDPEWLRSDVDEDVTGSRMYRKAISEKGKTSALKGLLGEEKFSELADAVNEAGSATAEELFTFLQENVVGNNVGFVLEQQQDKEESEDEEGNTVTTYFRTDRYQVGRFFLSSAVDGLNKGLATARAKKQEPKFKIMWEEGDNPLAE